MEPIPARLLRAEAERCQSRPPQSARDRQNYAFILEAAHNMLVQYGRGRLTIPALALATRLSELAIRRHILDLHNLFRIILIQYLDELLKAVGTTPATAPDERARRRAAYHRATRGFAGVPTRMHTLLTEERFTLPADQLETIERMRAMIGTILGGDDWQATLRTLDCPHTDLATAEAELAARAEHLRRRNEPPEPAQAAAPAPETPPAHATAFPFLRARNATSPFAGLPKPAFIPTTPVPTGRASLLATAARAGPR